MSISPVEVGLHEILRVVYPEFIEGLRTNIDRTIYHGAFPEGTAIRFEAFQLWEK